LPVASLVNRGGHFQSQDAAEQVRLAGRLRPARGQAYALRRSGGVDFLDAVEDRPPHERDAGRIHADIELRMPPFDRHIEMQADLVTRRPFAPDAEITLSCQRLDIDRSAIDARGRAAAPAGNAQPEGC